MTDLTPGEVALADQWHAEMMDEARAIIKRWVATHGLTLDADAYRLLELGYTSGSSATFLFLMREGWLRKPESDL